MNRLTQIRLRYFILPLLLIAACSTGWYLVAGMPAPEARSQPNVVAPRAPVPVAAAALPAPPRPRVAAVGDSLLYNLDTRISAYTDIAYRDDRAFTGAVTDAGYRPVLVSGRPGYATAELSDQVDTAVAARPDALVFVSGSNEAVDVAHGQAPTPDAASMADAIGAALDEMAGIGCVVWPTVTTQPNIPMYWGTQTWAPAEVNRALRDEAARRPNLHVVDWDALSAGHLPGSADPWYMPDGLHHTSAGETAFEAAILETLAQCEEER